MKYMIISILCNALVYIIEFYLDYRQSKFLRQSELPKELQGYVDEDEFREMREYSLLRLSFSRLESTYGFLSESGMLITYVLRWTWNVSQLTNEYLFGFNDPCLNGVLFLFIISMFSAIMKAPFELYRIFVIDSEFMGEHFEHDIKNWFKDQIKLFILSVGLGAPLLYGVLKLLQYQNQWVYVWLCTIVLAIIICEIYPSVLAPIFNTFSVLPEGELRTKIEELAKRIDFPISQIVCVDGSTRSENSNAFHMGITFTRKIVLYDNLINTLTTTELLSIISHEIAHYKYKHSLKMLLLQILSVGMYLYFSSLMINNLSFYQSFGFDKVELSVGICLFSYMYKALGNCVGVIMNMMQRRFEYTCDAFAFELGYDIKTSLIKIHVNNVYNIVVDKHYSRYYNSHPSLMERLEKIKELESKMK